MPYRLPPMQNQPAFHSMVPPVNQGNVLRGGIRPDLSPNISPRNYAPATYMGSAYPTVTGLQYPVAYPGAMMTHRPLSSSPGALSPTVVSSNSATPSGVGGSSGVQVEGLSSIQSFCVLLIVTLFFILGGAFLLTACVLCLRSTWC